MRRRTQTSLVALAVIAVTALAGCGGGEDETTTTATGPAAPQRDGGQGGKSGAGRQNDGGREGDGSAGGGSRAQDTSSLPPPEEGSKAPAPGVPTTRGGDNSIQVYGLESGSEERAEATAIVQGYLDARAVGDWATACTYLVASQRQQFEQLSRGTERLRGGGCAAAMRALTGATPRRVRIAEADIEVLSFRIDEENAFLIYRGVGDKVYATALDDEDGEWKLISVAPVPLNPTG